MKIIPLAERLAHERQHAQEILATNEDNWGWDTPAGIVRKRRRSDFLTKGYLGLPPFPKVLEVGCGTGTFSGDLAKTFVNLTSIDISETLLEAARSRHPNLTFRIEDIHRTNFADGTFDLVVGCSVLHHLDWDAAFQEMNRILKPSGQLRFSEPNLMNPQIFLQKNWGWLRKKMGDSPDERAFSAKQVSKSLENSGFEDILSEPFEFLHPSTPQSWIEAVIRLENWLEKTPLQGIAGSLKVSAKKKSA